MHCSSQGKQQLGMADVSCLRMLVLSLAWRMSMLLVTCGISTSLCRHLRSLLASQACGGRHVAMVPSSAHRLMLQCQPQSLHFVASLPMLSVEYHAIRLSNVLL